MATSIQKTDSNGGDSCEWTTVKNEDILPIPPPSFYLNRTTVTNEDTILDTGDVIVQSMMCSEYPEPVNYNMRIVPCEISQNLVPHVIGKGGKNVYKLTVDSNVEYIYYFDDSVERTQEQHRLPIEKYPNGHFVIYGLDDENLSMAEFGLLNMMACVQMGHDSGTLYGYTDNNNSSRIQYPSSPISHKAIDGHSQNIPSDNSE
jgi:hypothetical protein